MPTIGELAKSAWSFATGSYMERKFTPADPTVHWQYVEHLYHTANTTSPTTDGNSAVFACLVALANASVEAPLMVVRTIDDEVRPLMDSPLQAFLDEPHDELTILEIRWWLSYARFLDGNAYLIKARSGDSQTGLPVQLWPASPDRMYPHTERGSNRLIDWYVYKTSDGRGDIEIPVENVIHFKMGVDPRDPRLGLAPIKRLVREIATDAEATNFGHALLANYGIPGLVIALPIEAQLSPKQIEELKANTKREFAQGNQGKVGVLTGGATMEQFGFSPEQLNLKALHEFPETRIAAVMQVDPLVAKLGVGLDQSSNYASARQVRENFTELTIVPNWKIDEGKWTRKLARDFTSDRKVKIIHDLSNVRSLQEDETEKYKRVVEAFKAGILTRQEARIILGHDPEMDPAGIVHVIPGVQYVRVDNAETDPEALREQEREQELAVVEARPAPAPFSGNGTKAEDFATVAQSIIDTAAIGFTDDLAKLQDSRKRRVTRSLS